MSDPTSFSRRTMLAVPAALALSGTAACAQERQDGGTSPTRNSATLVAYLTRSGNTRVIAEGLQRALNADLFELRPATPYPADYEQHVDQATRERESGIEPPLAEQVAGIAGYDTVFLGFPIWGGSVPPPIRSFLSSHDLGGKVLRPFITHGGYGIGNARTILAEGASDAQIETPFVMEADQERRTLNQVRDWLGRIEG